MSKPHSCDRRHFLRQGTVGLAGSTILARASSTPALGDSGPDQNRRHFIDAHVHVWTDDLENYPLASGFTKTEMKPPIFPPEDLLERAKPSGVNRIALVQMSYYGFDNSYMLSALRRWPKVFRGIAVVDAESNNPDVKMRELARKGVRGFRIYPPNGLSVKWLAGDGIDKMFKCGAQNRLAMCLLVNPDDLPVVDRKCEKFPDTPVVIDHMARIGKDGPIRESDIQALCALARHKQVKVKISAFYALGGKKPPHSELAPLVQRLYEEFGPKRLMWASDCPFQIVDETYEDSISFVRDRLSFLSPADKEWILRRTAEESFFQKM